PRAPGLEVADEVLEVFSFPQRLQGRVSAELMGVVEARGDTAAEEPYRLVRGVGPAVLAGQRRGQGQVAGQVVKMARLRWPEQRCEERPKRCDRGREIERTVSTDDARGDTDGLADGPDRLRAPADTGQRGPPESKERGPLAVQ